MAIEKMATHAVKAINQNTHNIAGAKNFSKILQQKKSNQVVNLQAQNQSGPKVGNVKRVVNEVVNLHEKVLKSVRTSLVRKDFTPEELIRIQYRTGHLFMGEQMLCRTLENSANTFKNFTQMQV